MNDNFRCGDPEALVAYLYDDSDSTDREAMASHVARCVSCTEEIESLRATRAILATWTPPEASLGFRITRADEPVEPKVLRPAAWWRQPLPAWAQAAAALLIFASGIAFGGARENGTRENGIRENTVQPVATTTPAAVAVRSSAPQTALAPAVAPDDLARLEQRLRAVETARVQTVSPRPSAGTVDAAALLRQVEALIAASDDRQNATISAIVNAVRTLDAQQRQDYRQVADRVGAIHETTRQEIGRQNNAISIALTSLNLGTAR